MEIPDIYFECIGIQYNPSGVVIDLQLFGRQQGKPPVVGTIRCSQQQVKEIAFILRRSAREVEEKTGTPLAISPQRLQDLKVAREDWDTFWK